MLERIRDWLRRQREARDDRLAARWEPLVPYLRNVPAWGSPQGCVGMVKRHYGIPSRKGTKAYVHMLADGKTTAAWFKGASPAVGRYVLAVGALGNGSHEDPVVFYVDPGDLRHVVRADCKAAWERREQRRTAG